jgi:uncharacterized Zn-finger protein
MATKIIVEVSPTTKDLFYYKTRCDECGRGFKVIKDLMKHKKKPHTAEYLSFKFPCPIDKCGKRFRKEVALKRHMLLHQGVRPFKCDLCDQGPML